MSTYIFNIHANNPGFTTISNIFIDEYMPSADGSFVKVYLAGLMVASGGSRMPGDSLAKKLGQIGRAHV